MAAHCFSPDQPLFQRNHSTRPENFLRRILWKNSGLLCLVTLLALPIILGVAIGYVIILAIVTSYKKITGQKSREEKEDEAAKKIRIVMGHDLLDSAYTKPVKLPGQQKKYVAHMPRYGSVNRHLGVVPSMDGNESREEAVADDEVGRKTLKKEKVVQELENVQECTNESGTKAGNSSVANESSAESSRAKNKPTADSTLVGTESCAKNSPAANESFPDSSRATSASSEYYSTATDMEEPTQRCHSDDTAQVPQEHPEKQNKEATSDVVSPKSPVKTVAQSTNTLPQGVPIIPRNEMVCTPQLKPVMPPAHGKLKFSVQYLKDKNQLQVTILKAINLFDSTLDSRPSSLVKVCLLPQRFCWQRTKTVERTLNPVYNETFIISGFSHDRLASYTLLICVVNSTPQWQGHYGDNVIGEIHVPLMHLAKNTDNDEKEMFQWAELKPKMAETQGLSKCGKINLALCYRPISGRLIVTVKKAKDLKCQSREKFDPYVKLALYCGGTRVGRGATRVKCRVTNPVFSEKFNFDLTSNQIAYTTLVLKVMNNVESAPACLAATIIGYESSGDGQEHWLCMMECLSQHVDAWHALYD